MNVLFVDLRRQHALMDDEISAAIQTVRDNSWYILGRELEAFEKEYADYHQVKHAIGVGNGLDALTLTLRGLEIGQGDEVIVPTHTFVASVSAVTLAGATPVLVDCESDTLAVDPDAIARAITPRTRAVIVVHLYGRLVDMDRVGSALGGRSIPIIEDAAQAHGAIWNGRKAGAFGHAGCFSFYPTKNLGAFGDGGAVITNDDDLAQRLHMLRNYGSVSKYVHETPGMNSRLDELQAAILRPKLRYLARTNRMRQDAAEHYRRRLMGRVHIPALPRAKDAADHVAHVFCVQVPNRDRVQERLSTMGVQTAVHYPIPVHLQPIYREMGLGPGRFPHAELAARELLSLPIFPGITTEELDYVADRLLEAIEESR